MIDNITEYIMENEAAGKWTVAVMTVMLGDER